MIGGAVALALVLVMGGAAQVGAQGWIAQGAQFQVNGTTTSGQNLPAVAIAGDGSFVVVWESFVSPEDDASLRSIQARRYSAAGAPLAAQFQVNTTTAEEQKSPAVAMNAAGAFVIAWESDSLAGAGTDFDIRARIYDAAGTPDGGDFLVNATTSQEQLDPAVAMRADGSFDVVWESDVDLTASEDKEILYRAFNSEGAPFGGEFDFSATGGGAQQNPAIAVNDDGAGVVVWQSATSPGGDTTTDSIQAVFAPPELGFGGQFQVNLDTPVTTDSAPAVAIAPDGRFAVAWESNSSSGSDSSLASIQLRLYDGGTSPNGDPVQVNSYTPDVQRFPALGMDALGRLVVAWQSYGSPGNDASDFSLQVRAFDDEGGALGGETQANGFTDNGQTAAALAVDTTGRIVVAWESNGSPGDDVSGYSVQARRYVMPTLFADGFESGDRSRWEP